MSLTNLIVLNNLSSRLRLEYAQACPGAAKLKSEDEVEKVQSCFYFSVQPF